MIENQENTANELKPFNPNESTKQVKAYKIEEEGHRLQVRELEFVWTTKMERVHLIRHRLPSESIDVVSKKVNLPVKQVLNLLGLPQTTYNKKKRENDLLSGRDSELILVLTELLDFGMQVFNGEREKFLRWMKKPNVSLGGYTPESLFDSLTGIQEVKNCLNRLEYGSLA